MISALTSWVFWINISFPAPQLVNQKCSTTKCKICFSFQVLRICCSLTFFTKILCEVLGYLKSFDCYCGIITAFTVVDLHTVFIRNM